MRNKLKYYLILILVFVLGGCEEKNVIEVKHTKDGYTSELLATIQLQNEESGYYIQKCGENTFCVNDLNIDELIYEVNLNTREVKQIDQNIQDVDQSEITETKVLVYQDKKENYMIYLETESYRENNQAHMVYTFYYEKDGKMDILLEYDELIESSLLSNFHYSYNPASGNVCFLMKEDASISLKEVIAGELVEVDRKPLKDGNYKLIQYSIVSDGIAFQYENSDTIRILINDEEILIDKYVDDYTLEDFQIYDLSHLKYTKDGHVRLLLDDVTYDLGYNAYYILKDDYVLSSAWKEEGNIKETKYIDRKTHEVYVLSEFIDVDNARYIQDTYFNRDYSNDDKPYYILHVEDKEMTYVELPFSKEFEMENFVDEHSMIFTHQNGDELNLYLVSYED